MSTVEPAERRHQYAVSVLEALARALYVASGALLVMLVILLLVSMGDGESDFPIAGVFVLVPMVAAALSLQISAATLGKPEA